ncbi:MAG: VOC family protein [Candidatus Thorarchaeota archaeon]
MVESKILASTYQVRVTNFFESIKWYEKILGRPADFMGGEEFYEWELFPNMWLQVAKGNPGKNTGPLRFGVNNIHQERKRLIAILNTEISEIEIGPVAAWCNFSDFDGNLFGLFQDLEKHPLKQK